MNTKSFFLTILAILALGVWLLAVSFAAFCVIHTMAVYHSEHNPITVLILIVLALVVGPQSAVYLFQRPSTSTSKTNVNSTQKSI